MPTPHVLLYNSAPAVAVLDQNFNLTLSWTPQLDTLMTGSFSTYNHWDIVTQVGLNPVITVAFPTPAFAGGSLTYTQILSAGVVTLNMQAWFSGDDSVFLTNPWQTNGGNAARQFPDAISGSNIAFSLTSVLLNQPLTVTLSSGYAGQVGNTANQWQVLWPDGTSTGWLPLASNVVTKQFTVPGAENVIIQTRASYAGSQYAPPATLIRQFTQQVLVVNQQASSSLSSQGGLTGSLGIGGQQGFEIVGTTGTSVTPEPWEAIVRCIVRDTVTNELKLLIATSRFSNASSLYGTMAADVFPMEGRPHAKELIQPPYELTATSQTETVPVSVATSTLPTLIVGKSVTEALGGTFSMSTSGTSGIAPFIWSSSGLPDGLTLNGSGNLLGTPLELGTFQVTFTVQDSSVPFSVAETTLPLTVETDLMVEIAANQTDATGSVLAQLGTSLGVAQVNTPYAVLMEVGNINPAVPTSGGLPPYTWIRAAGALPVGLSIDPSTGLISGSPSTYNSTTDFNTIFSATVQVTDAIGAKATQTYSMTLVPAVLQFGQLDQTTIFAGQQFQLVVPVFGGQSPYTFNPLTNLLVPSADTAYYDIAGAQLVDGQILINVNFPQTATGQHTFQVTVHDSVTPTAAVAVAQFTFNVENQISDPFFVPASLDYVWQWAKDVAKPTPLALTGGLSGFSMAGLNVGVNIVTPGVGQAIYTVTGATCSFGGGAGDAYAGSTFVVSGFFNAGNNGTFLCTASGGSPQTVTLANPNSVAETLSNVLNLASVQAASVGSPFGPLFVPTSKYLFTAAVPAAAGNAYAGQQFTVTGFFTNPAVNNGTFYCVESATTYVVLANGAAIAETHAATATQTTAKALAIGNQYSGATLANGITVAIDPAIPEVEFTPPGNSPGISYSGSNAQYAVPIQLQFGVSPAPPVTQATVSQTYTVLATNTSTPFLPTDIGAMTISTHPYLYGAGLNELVGLNPRKPWYNSPNIPAMTPSPAPPDAPWIATVGVGSSLPPGLSLDANTGLVYGNLVGSFNGHSTIKYVGSTGTVHGSATISWASPSTASAFQLIDNIADGITLGTAYPATSYILVPAGTTPASASIFYGRLPAGLSPMLVISGQNVLITGAATEAGYFDTWFQVTATNGQSSFLHHRFSIDFQPPLTIITTTLPDISNEFYGPYTVQAIGGVPNSLGQYQWSLGTLPSGAAGLGISATTGQISGTLTPPPVAPTPLAIPVIVQDYNSPTPTVYTATVNIQYNNALRITTVNIATVVPLVDDPLGTGEYSFQMQAAGGTPDPTHGYKWQITPAANLPTPGTAASLSLTEGASQCISMAAFLGTSGNSVTVAVDDTTTGAPTVVGNAITLHTLTYTVASYVAAFPSATATAGLINFSYTGLGTDTFTTAGAVNLAGGTNGITPANGTSWNNGTYVFQDAGGGVFGGSYTGTELLTFPILISVEDTTLLPTTPLAFNVDTGTYILAIDDSGAGPIPPGFAYQGTLSAAGICTQPPVQWQVAPTPQYPLTLSALPGLSLTVNGAGVTATVSGTYSGPAILPASPTCIRFVAVDSVGNTGVVVHPFYTHTNLAISGWDTVPTSGGTISFPLPHAFVATPGGWAYNGAYSGGIQLVATQGVAPYTWSVAPPITGAPYFLALSTAGVLTNANAGSFSNVPFTFMVTDSIGNTATLSLNLSSQASGLAITTPSIGAFLAGTAYTTSNEPSNLPLAATLGTPPYTFSISPNNPAGNALPTGLSLTASGYITGTTIQGGYSEPVTFRVTDSIGSYSDKVLTVSVTVVLALYSGIDYTDCTATNALGYVDKGNVSSVNPRPNLSFYIIATGVVSTSPATITITTSNPAITGTVVSLSAIVPPCGTAVSTQTAKIALTGPFNVGVVEEYTIGTYPLSVTVVDSGISITGVFNWVVFDDGTLVLAPSSGSIPTQAIG
jgi:hypothetical protein